MVSDDSAGSVYIYTYAYAYLCVCMGRAGVHSRICLRNVVKQILTLYKGNMCMYALFGDIVYISSNGQSQNGNGNRYVYQLIYITL